MADRLHSAAIHLLRRLRTEDAATGLTPPQASALSVVVFGGPIALGALAAAEQVRPPTITRLVARLEREGLMERVVDPDDARVQRVRATARGERLLSQGRTRRVTRLAADLAALPAREREILARAVEILARVARPPKVTGPHAPDTPAAKGRTRGGRSRG